MMEYSWDDKKVLIVEDDFLSLKFLEAILDGTGATIITAKTGREAVEVIKNDEVDLILMDIQLPGMSGNEATELIREFNKETPIIAQTAHAMSDDKKRSMDAGCDDYITKPIDSELLLHKIDEQFKRYKR